MEQWRAKACLEHIGNDIYQFNGEMTAHQFSRDWWIMSQIKEKFQPHIGFIMSKMDLVNLRQNYVFDCSYTTRYEPRTQNDPEACWIPTNDLENVQIDFFRFEHIIQNPKLYLGK